MAKDRVLITGASGGIGLELAHLFAADGHALILVARDRAKLDHLSQTLSKKHGVEALVVPTDLSVPGAASELVRILRQQNKVPQILVNNAGFGHFGEFQTTPWDRESSMVQLNITALTELTKGFLPDMLAAKHGRILNVASTAAFQPGPFMAVYYATKAYVLSFSEALFEEMRGTGVTVTTLCPGPTTSGFQEAAQLNASRLMNSAFATATSVARAGYLGVMRGKRLVVPGLMNKIQTTLVSHFLPRSLVLRLVRFVQQRVKVATRS